MKDYRDASLQLSINALAVPGVIISHRLITEGDERALLPEESESLARSVVKVRRASGAARIVARELLAQLGYANKSLPKSTSGAPIWPEGTIGSLAHDSHAALAAVGKRSNIAALGIDIEPLEILPFDLNLIATPRERLNLGADPYVGRLLFTAKEAVYKAVHPLHKIFLDHHDVEVDFNHRKATVRGGHIVDLRFCISTHIITVAFLLNQLPVL
jgi:4'-phosphopantetheinyl transferase EntD